MGRLLLCTHGQSHAPQANWRRRGLPNALHINPPLAAIVTTRRLAVLLLLLLGMPKAVLVLL
jgi:hypothetical protein